MVSGQTYFRRGKQKALRVEKVLEQSELRGQPFCPKYTLCGGCQLQHLKLEAYQNFKTQLLHNALKRLVILNHRPSLLIGSSLHKDVGLAYLYSKRHDQISLGFYRHRSHHIERIDSCPLLLPELNDLIIPLRQFLSSFCQNRESGFVHLTKTDNGIDLSWSPAKFKSRDLTIEKSQKWIEFAKENGISRVTRAAKDLIVEYTKPALNWSGVQVPFPSASFLQPSSQSEQYMVQTMLSWLSESRF